MEIYKKGQGKVVRMCALAGFLLLILYGSYSLDVWPMIEDGSALRTAIIPNYPAIGDISLDWILLISVVLFLGFGFLAFWVLNRPKYSDFLIETESEVKKVSWPQRKEYLAASAAVFAVVLFVFCFLWATDTVFTEILSRIGIGF